MWVLASYLTHSRHSVLVEEIYCCRFNSSGPVKANTSMGRAEDAEGAGMRAFEIRQASMKAAPVNCCAPMGALVLQRVAWRVLWAGG